jgi:hypothetical protein
MVERQLPKLDVAGSIPVARSKFPLTKLLRVLILSVMKIKSVPQIVSQVLLFPIRERRIPIRAKVRVAARKAINNSKGFRHLGRLDKGRKQRA